MIDGFQTKRLLARPFCAGDLPAFVAYRRDPGVARYQSWDVDYSMADAEVMLAELAGVGLGAADGWVQLALVDREDGGFVGDCASRVMGDRSRTAEIGVTIAPASQGRGFAGEALRGLVGVLFDRRVRRVIAEVDDRNVAAQRVLERLGFRLEARFVDAEWFKGEWTTLRVYAVIRGETAGLAAGGTRIARPRPADR